MRVSIVWQAAAAIAILLSPAPGMVDAPASTPHAEGSLVPAATIRADFAYLYRGLRSAHFDLHARVSRADYDRRYRRELAAIRGPETRLQVARRFQRFAAFGQVAHARLDFAYQAYSAWLAGGGRTFPLSLRVTGGRAFIVANRSGLAGINVGDEVKAIDGRPVRSWLARCRRNLSADNDYMANALLELDLPMLLWLEVGERASFTVKLRRGTLTVPARSSAEMAEAARAQPSGLDLSGRDARMIGTTAYLRPGPFYNVEAAETAPYDNAAFRSFIDGAFERFLAAGAERLIVDLRENPGGDSAFSDLMVSWFATRPYRFNSVFQIKVSRETIASNDARLAASTDATRAVSERFARLYAGARPGAIVTFDTPWAQPKAGRRFEGRVYVLINRNSFSNAVAVAATIQDYRFGTILGEETSDLATTYGAMETFELPLTKLVVGFPKARIIRPSGDLAPRGVVPDIAIATPFLESADDPVLQRALVLIQN